MDTSLSSGPRPGETLLFAEKKHPGTRADSRHGSEDQWQDEHTLRVEMALLSLLIEDLSPSVVLDTLFGETHFATMNRSVACLDQHFLGLCIVEDL